MIEELAHQMVNDTQQEVTYKLQDLINSYSPVRKIIAIAAIKSNINAIMASIGEEPREIIEHIVEHTEVTVLPDFLDPRRHGK